MDYRNCGNLIISVDFELYWGVMQRRGLGDYGNNIAGARDAALAMIELFDRYEVKTSWGYVGALTFSCKEDLLCFVEKHRDDIVCGECFPYNLLGQGLLNIPDKYLFCPDVVDLLASNDRVDLVSHGFLHAFPLDHRNDTDVLSTELKLFRRREENLLWKNTAGYIFPRNQYNDALLSVLAANGFRYYRAGVGSRLRERLLSLGLMPIASRVAAKERKGLKEIHAGSFFRLGAGVPYFVSKVKRALTFVSKTGGLVHIWWHPHNLGIRLQESLKAIEDVLVHFSNLRDDGCIKSETMRDLAIG